MQNLYPPPPPSLIPSKPFDQPRRVFGEATGESGGGRRTASLSWTRRRRAGYAARGSTAPQTGPPAPETGAPSSRADAHPDFGRSSAFLARAASVDSSGSGKPERGVSPRGPSHARTRQSLTLQSRLTPTRPIARPERGPSRPENPQRISPHLPSWRDRPIVAESSCAATRRRHFPRNLIFRNLRKNPVNLSIFIEFYGNSIFLNEATGSAIIPESPESARTATAGKCGSISNGMQRISSRCRKGAMSAQPQMRGNAPRREPLIGAVEKPLLGGIAFTPLTRGGKGGCFSSREGRRLSPLVAD